MHSQAKSIVFPWLLAVGCNEIKILYIEVVLNFFVSLELISIQVSFDATHNNLTSPF